MRLGCIGGPPALRRPGKTQKGYTFVQTQTELFSKLDLRRLLVPLVIEQFLAVTVGIADTMMVSVAGEAAISGVSLVDMVNILLINIFAALATGGAVVISQFLGAKQTEKAKESAGQLFGLAGLAGCGIMALVLVFAKPLLHLLFGNVEADVMAAALLYLQISALSFPFLALYNAGAALFRSLGDSGVSMRISVIMNVVNVIGNAVLVFGFHMGVAGVALPSLVGRALAAVLIIRRAMNPHGQLPLSLRSCFQLKKNIVGRILQIGVPSAFENSLFQLGRLLVLGVITAFGTVQIAANAVANNLDNIGNIPGQAIGLALVAVVGRCVGAQDNPAAVRYTKKLVGFAYLVDGVLNLSVIACLTPLLSLYNLSGASLELARVLVWLHAGFAVVMWPLAFVLPNALRAANDVRFTMYVSIGSMVVWRIGLSYILGMQMGMGAIGVWIAMLIDWVCRSAFFTIRFIRGKWKTKYQA